MKINKYINHTYVYYFGLTLMVIGLPLSNFLMSISQFILVGNWLVEGNIKQKIYRFWKNRSAVLISSVFLLHLLGLIYTSDFDYALNDIRIKISLLILPIIISSSIKLCKEKFEKLMLIFVVSVIIGTIASVSELTGFNNYLRELANLTTRQLIDTRSISIFISHIRFSLLICIAIYFLCYMIYTYYNKTSLFRFILYNLLLIWLLVFLVILESITGIAVLLITALIMAGYFAVKKKSFSHKISCIIFLVATPVIIISYLYYLIDNLFVAEPVKIESLDKYTKSGNAYSHDINNKQIENGNYVWLYLCEEELANEWNKRSSIKYSEKDQRGQHLKQTLIRFLTSKGLRKDAEGVNSLNNEEIEAVEKGIANINYQNSSSLNTRIQQIIWEYYNYKNGGNLSGNSVMQRLEFWRAAVYIIGENPVFGVGTGDVKTAFKNQYEKMDTSLDLKYRKRAHNQYLTFGVAFGIIGFVWFIFSLVYPIIAQNKMFDYFYAVFFMIALLSMFTEDTLETQAGVSFFILFNCLLLFGRAEDT